ncbi:LPS-assembly protein LptD [Candidatus Pelagibacter sp.]|uniref:LPS-assembly protein LptD n=1 Tax=Candidatus Pelagibacter sp. TaxID=2024849 RepID=UPI003D0A127F
MLKDKEKNTEIFSNKATYLKNDEVVFTEGNSKAINENNIITASNFKFDKIQNILIADENVKFLDKEKNTEIFSNKATYLKNDEVVFTEGKTSAIIEERYEFISKNIRYNKKINQLLSKHVSSIRDRNGNFYEAESFDYRIDKKFLKGKNINLYVEIETDKIDKYFFSDGFFDLNKQSFVAKDTKVKVHKNIFDDDEQDPRLYGVSSRGDNEFTIVKKGIFTSCKITDDCPPWSIYAKKITHDKVKKDIIYNDAIFKVYDIPVFYFPKFFHPDPTVERRTGFLRPQFNSSNILGDSLYVPYFKTLGENRDYTFNPTFFDDKKIIFQNEYRQENKSSSLITDFALLKNYKSSTTGKRKNVNHLFLNYQKKLNFENFENSNLDLKIERVNDDTYLKVFQNNLISSPVMPNNKNLMHSQLNFNFENDNYDLSTNFQVFESLGTKHSDRYQYIFPSYTFNKNVDIENINGTLNFASSGSNDLKNTNNLTTTIANDLNYSSINYYTNYGLQSNFAFYLKNSNLVSKNDSTLKSSPTIDLMSFFETTTSFPLIKINDLSEEILTPKISFRMNPSNNMKDNRDSNRKLSVSNIFNTNRLGLSNSFETGKSFTLGIDYKYDVEETKINKEYVSDKNTIEKDKFLEFKLATVFRDSYEDRIPTSSTINKKNSNLFGSLTNNLYDNFEISYDFSIDNSISTFESHSLNTKISINNFVTDFGYVEERGDLGSSHLISNTTSYNFNDKNSISFSTKRNKNISLTEYYNLTYEYKNDCLTAGVVYDRTFYKDDDLVPSENLFLSITFIPLTTYERKLYERDKYGK